MTKYLSIDIGGTNVKYAELNESVDVIAKGKVKTEHNLDDFLAEIDQIIDKFQADGLSGIAFCAPGKIEDTTIRFGGALPFLDGVDFAKRYEKLGLPVAVVNDGKASALAESWLGSLQGVKNGAAIVLGTGVGGGIIVNGQLLAGEHFQAGELSFGILNVDKTGFDATVGSYGSAVGMIERVNQAIGNEDTTDGLAAFNAINAGKPEAVAIFKNYCKNVAYLILNVQSVVDLKRITIGGGISAQDAVIDGIREAINEIREEIPVIKMTLTPPEIVRAQFMNTANIYGALYNLLLKVEG